MVLDYCPGGEFFFHLSKNGRLDEQIARFYFWEVLLALEYLHLNGIIYRDLKPENILLDADGHVVLTDFGLSKTDFDRTTFSYSFWGSPEYMSPEMLDEMGHGFPMDIYSLGALLYEFVTGLPPHYSQDREELFFNIWNHPIVFPSYLSWETKDLLEKLLKKDPYERLGAISGISEIKNHPFCKSIDFEALLEKRYIPPFIPSKTETYFDLEYLENQINENPSNYFPIDKILFSCPSSPPEKQAGSKKVTSTDSKAEKSFLSQVSYSGYSFYRYTLIFYYHESKMTFHC
jgi:serum/glucocorticoid-regulated kinase 2